MDIQALQTITDNYTKELRLSAAGEATSLAFIKNIIPSSPLMSDNEIFQIIVVGGSILRSALVQKTGNTIEILQVDDVTLPQLATKDIFLSCIEQYVSDDVSMIAINFAFPIEPLFVNGRLQGSLSFATKEHAFEGLLGKNVCEEIEKYLQEKRDRTYRVSIANDTICLLLSGLTQENTTAIAAGIIGTGLNFAMFLDKHTPVNLESGGFSAFTPPPLVATIDKTALKPGHFLFEKAIAGGYLFKQFNQLITEGKIHHAPLSQTVELDTLARNDTSEVGQKAQSLLKDSASLAACAIAGIANFQKQDMTFVMQGSLFWKGYHYKETVEQTVKQLTNYNVNFIAITESDILGAAKLVA